MIRTAFLLVLAAIRLEAQPDARTRKAFERNQLALTVGSGVAQELDASSVEAQTAVWVGTAALSALWAHSLIGPRPLSSPGGPAQSGGTSNRVRFLPENLAFVAARTPGVYPLLRIAF